MSSYLIKGTAAEGTLRVLAAHTTEIVQESSDRHNLSITATAALGRLLTGAALFAQVISKHEKSRVTLRVQGGGPIGYLLAEGSTDGSVRGYVANPHADLPPRTTDGKLDVGGLVGSDGDVAVMRLLENTDPYTSSTALVSGEIADDLTFYLVKSEQVPSALLLGVYLEGGKVHTAGGLLIQVMPGASDATIAQLETNIKGLGSVTEALRGRSLIEVIQKATERLGFEQMEDALPIKLNCRCSREKAIDSLKYFSEGERAEMANEGGQEVVCDWCGTRYQITPQEIQES